MSFNELPEKCIAKVLSFTNPRDACRLAAVSPRFRSASESDVVWERFLPDDLESIISKSNSPSLPETVTSKKQLYLSLCDNPIIVENGRKSFSLEKRSAKICYMLSARGLIVTEGDNTEKWIWTSNPVFRFPEVAQLIRGDWIEICCKINTSILSPTTLYNAYLAFQLSKNNDGFYAQSVKVTMKLDGVCRGEGMFVWNEGEMPFGWDEIGGHYSNEIRDRWLEIELGNFFSKGSKHEELEIRVFDGAHYWKHGLIVAGIEFRPKELFVFQPRELGKAKANLLKGCGKAEDMLFSELPEECIANVLSFTRPKDACQLSSVSPTFRSASESDVVWQRFLPDDLKSIISKSNFPSLPETVTSKKQLYLSLCDNPIIVENGRKSFSLEKRSGKICYMLSARDLIITEGDNPEKWIWTSNPVFRFPEVAQLIHGYRIEICCKINTSILSPATSYNAYLAFQLSRNNDGFYAQPVKATVKLDGVCCGERIFVWNEGEMPFGWNKIGGHYSNEIRDGWLEIEMAQFFSKGSKHEELEIRVFDGAPYWKHGLVVAGIEFRPTESFYILPWMPS